MKQFFKSHYGITAVLLINLIFYVIIIFKVPWFFSDDFYIFYRVGENLKTGLFPGISEEYYLFFRPITYLTFVLEYIFLYNNPVGIKFVTIVINSGFLLVFYFSLRNLCQIFKIKQNNLIIAFIILIISLHPVTYHYIIWISATNIPLLNLFLSLSLYYLTKFIISKKNYQLILSAIFFIFAALSKQQALAFPGFIIVFYFALRANISNKTKKLILKYFLSILIFSVFLIIINALLLENFGLKYFIMYLYKKPFVLLGSFYTIIMPLFQIEVYNYFTEHIYIASAIFILLISASALIFLKYRRFLIYAFVFTILWLISFFPQIIVNNDIRNLNMQLLVFALILLVILLKAKNNILIYSLFSLLLILNISSTLIAMNNSRQYVNMNLKQFDRLTDVVHGNENKYYIIISTSPGYSLSYEYYYSKYRIFGKDDISGLKLYTFFNDNRPEKWSTFSSKYLDVNISGNSLLIKSNDMGVSIVGDIAYYNITESIPNKHRGFQYIKMSLPEEAKDKILIYFDGEKWVKLN